MFLARVTGSVVATQKVASMTGHKLLTVEPYRVDEKTRDRLVPTGRTFVVVDTLGAGLDEMVLICQGSSARLTPETEKLPIDAVVIGLVDTVDVGGKVDLLEPRAAIGRTIIDTSDLDATVPAMQMTEDLIRSVVQQVLSQMGGGGPGRRTADGRRAVGQVRRLPDRRRRRRAPPRPRSRRSAPGRSPTARRPSTCIREDLRRAGRGTRPAGAGGDEDRPARPQDRQAPRRDPAGARASSTSGPRTGSGDDGLTLTDYAPFGVIGAITPVTHSLPTLAGNAINMLAAGNTVVFNAHPSGAKIAAEGRPPVQPGDPRGDRPRRPAHDHRPADARIGRRALRPRGREAARRHRRPGGRAGGPGEQAAGDRRRAGQPAGRRRRDGLPRERREVDRRRGGVRQQPALHRREAGLRRRRHLRQADGRRRPPRRLPAQRRRRSTP